MSIEEVKVQALQEIAAQFAQAGLTGDALTKATEIAAAGIVVRLNQSGEIIKEFRSYVPHKDAMDYAQAVLQQHGAALGGTGRTFRQMMQ